VRLEAEKTANMNMIVLANEKWLGVSGRHLRTVSGVVGAGTERGYAQGKEVEGAING